MYGTQTDTIVTHVLRNGTLQTYTFRLPVVTRVINPQDGSIRITSRYASNGKILSKVTDGDGNLVQLRSSYGQSDGSTITRTEYPDGSWSQVRTHGEADGTVTRETTSGLPSLGSGNCGPIAKPPIPGIRSDIGTEFGSESGVAHIPSAQVLSSGATFGPKPPPPCSTCGNSQNLHLLVSGQVLPGNMPRPGALSRTTQASTDPRARISRDTRPEFTRMASGNATCPRPPLPSLASGITILGPRPPRPIVA